MAVAAIARNVIFMIAPLWLTTPRNAPSQLRSCGLVQQSWGKAASNLPPAAFGTLHCHLGKAENWRRFSYLRYFFGKYGCILQPLGDEIHFSRSISVLISINQ